MDGRGMPEIYWPLRHCSLLDVGYLALHHHDLVSLTHSHPLMFVRRPT